MRKLQIGWALAALVAAGCASDRSCDLACAEDAPVADVAAIDEMTGDELTVKRVFVDGGRKLPYRLHAPAKTGAGMTYPLVLFLHGSGERGNDNTRTLVNGVLQTCRYAMKHGDAFVVVPQCPSGKSWVKKDWGVKSMRRTKDPTAEMSAVIALLRDFVAKHPVDRSRIYVTGVSMGGFGAWDIVSRMPGVFAAMMPICGGADETTASAHYNDGANLGIRFFHGGADASVTPEFSRRMDKALTDAGIPHVYTEYPGVGHYCWTPTFADVANLDWLFAQRRRDVLPANDGLRR